MPSSAKAQTTLASWTFDTAYTVDDYVYTPTSGDWAEIGYYWFDPATPKFLPQDNVGNKADFIITGKTARYWQVLKSNNVPVLRFTNDTEANEITDYTDKSQHKNYFEIQFPTTGYKNIQLDYHIANHLNIAHSIIAVASVDEGITWKVVGTQKTTNAWYTFANNSLYLESFANNQTKVIIRLLFANGVMTHWYMKDVSISGIETAATPTSTSLSFVSVYSEGIVPTTVSQAPSTTYELPSNFLLYKENYTLTGWTDGSETYKAGDTYTFTEHNTCLTAIFTENAVFLDDRTAATSVVWNFRRDQKAPMVDWNDNSHIWVAQPTVGDQKIDLKMEVNASGAVFRNTGNTDWAQVNSGTTFVIPAVSGMTISLLSYYDTKKTTTFNGEYNTDASTGSAGNWTTTYSYSGSSSTMTIVIGEGSYFRNITATYPAPETVTISPAKEYTTFCSTSALNFTAVTGLEAYAVTGSTTSAITLTQVKKVPASTGLILRKTGSSASYDVPVGDAASLGVTNKLVGVTVDTDFTAGDYILSNGTFVRGTAGTLAAGKAYLPAANIDTSANILTFIFEDGETTGISAVERMNTTNDNVFYNLSGQRVAQPTKGLYIVNGKKVIIK